MNAKQATGLVVAGALVAAGIAAALAGWRPWAADGAHRLDAGDDGAVVEVAVGDEILLELEGNDTTGYTWAVTSADPAVLALEGDPDYVVSSDADGAGGTYLFRFEVVGPGETDLVLEYFRPWAEVSPAARSFTVRVVAG